MTKKQPVKGDMEQVGREVAKRKTVGNPAMTGEAITVEPSVQETLIEQSLMLANIPNIDLHDVEQVRQRVNDYFRIVTKNGNRPTVAGLGLALNNMSRQRLWEIRTGQFGNTRGKFTTLPREVTDLIKKAYRIMEELWENYMQTGRINPVSGIFLGKNHFGYQDKQDVVITPNQPESDYSAKEIADRYSLPEATDET